MDDWIDHCSNAEYAFTVQGNSVLTLTFTFDNFARFFSDPIFPGVLWKSLKMALITTFVCIAIGYPHGSSKTKITGLDSIACYIAYVDQYAC